MLDNINYEDYLKIKNLLDNKIIYKKEKFSFLEQNLMKIIQKINEKSSDIKELIFFIMFCTTMGLVCIFTLALIIFGFQKFGFASLIFIIPIAIFITKIVEKVEIKITYLIEIVKKMSFTKENLIESILIMDIVEEKQLDLINLFKQFDLEQKDATSSEASLNLLAQKVLAKLEEKDKIKQEKNKITNLKLDELKRKIKVQELLW